MIHSKNLSFLLFVVLLLVSFGGHMLQQTKTQRLETSELNLASANRSITTDYISHDPIAVNNDAELAAVAITGMGTEDDPYILAGWKISSSPDCGIYITNTTKYFRIENCWIDGSNDYGIFVKRVATGTASIVKNTFNNNDAAGIYIQASSSTIANNTFFNDGLYLGGLWSSKEHFLSFTVENNVVNELPLGYFENLSDSTITGTYGQLILINCNNTIVKNQNCPNLYVGIALYYCHENQLVKNTCDNNYRNGIYISLSVSSALVNNICNNNNYGEGIFLTKCDNSTIANNTCNNNGEGMMIRYSRFTSITNNTCNSNIGSGIYLDYSSYSTVTNNICNSNGNYGITSYNSGSSTIANNTCNDNRQGSISLYNSDTSTNPIDSSSSPAFTHSILIIVFGLILFIKKRYKSVS